MLRVRRCGHFDDLKQVWSDPCLLLERALELRSLLRGGHVTLAIVRPSGACIRLLKDNANDFRSVPGRICREKGREIIQLRLLGRVGIVIGKVQQKIGGLRLQFLRNL